MKPLRLYMEGDRVICAFTLYIDVRAGEPEQMRDIIRRGLSRMEGRYDTDNGPVEIGVRVDIAERFSLGAVNVRVEVLKSKGYNVSERLLSIDELAEALENGTLEEAWGCGTAAVVSPIGKLAYKDKEYIVSGGKIGEVTQMLYDTLTGIQWSKIEDTFGWIVPVC